MTGARAGPPDDELAALRAENAALDEQVKLLVQTEQRLFRSQNEREQELRRIRAIGGFALELVGQPVDEVLDRTLAVLHDCFALDGAAVVVAVGADDVLVRRDRAVAPVRVAGVAAALAAATATEVHEGGAPPTLAPLCAALGLPTDGTCAIIPIDGTRRVIATSIPRRRPAFRAEPVAAIHLPLLALIGSHVARVLEHAALTDDLERRSRTLAEVNERLTASLHAVEEAQAQLLAAGKMEAMGRLAGGVAHDFNNLLTVILSHATLAAEEVTAGSSAAVELDAVIDAAKRAAEITSQLLALGRTTVQRREHVDAGEAARALGRVLRGLLGRRVTLEVSTEPGCAVFADRAQIEQVLLNLVINARDAMPAGGTVRVAVRHADLRDRARLPSADGAWVAIEVADSGVGMDASTRARIFEPFFTTKAGSQGTGLGLAVVWGVVNQSEGVVAVDSAPGQGSRFVVLLPRASGPVAAPEPTAAAATPGARVLVVEDSEAIRKLAIRILERAGYAVSEAADGVAALEAVEARAGALDLVLTDLNMPRMGGLELSRRLAERVPGLPVLFMTGYSEELADVSRQAPTIACMTKPFTPRQLLAEVARQLAGGAAAEPGPPSDPSRDQ